MKIKKLSFAFHWCASSQQRRFMKRHAKNISTHPAVKTFAENLWQSWIGFHKVYVNDQVTVNHLPVTLIIGLAACGKTAFLNASKQILPQSAQLNTTSKPTAGFAMPHYYVSNQRLWIELPEYLWFGEEPYLEILLDFWQEIGLLAKMKQMVFTVSLSQLISPKDHSLLYRNVFWRSLSVLVSHFKQHSLPIQVMVTEIDRLQGFVEFFSDLSLEERQHAFGLTIHSQQDWLSQARQKFQMLKNRLHNRMWWRCQSEHIHSRRLLVAEFPEQFAQLQQPLMRLFKYLRELQNVQPNLTIKGCYFVSNFQHGNLFDLLTQHMPFELNRQTQTLPMIPQRKNYFVRGCWQQITKSNDVIASQIRQRVSLALTISWKKISLSLLGSVLGITFLALSYWQVSWWQLTHDLQKNGALAYKLMVAEQPREAYTAFVAYELPHMPLRWQMKMAQNPELKNIVMQSALLYINDQWNKEVYSFYHQHLQNLYPLKLDAKASVSINNFNEFFAPQGRLISFYQQYLQSPQIQNYLALQPHVIRLFSQVVKLKQWLYANQNTLNLNFSVYANHLASGVSQINFMLAGVDLSLHPNVLGSRTINWPSQASSNQSGYAIIYKNALPQTVQLHGDWSWLQLLQGFNWQQVDATTWNLTAKDQAFSLTLNSDADLQAMLSLLSQITINEKLFNGN